MTYDELVEKVAQVICHEWGYIWDGDPDDVQTAPEDNLPYDDRPSKKLFREASIAAIDTIREVLMEPTPAMGAVISKNWGRRTWSEYRDVLAASPLGEKKG